MNEYPLIRQYRGLFSPKCAQTVDKEGFPRRIKGVNRDYFTNKEEVMQRITNGSLIEEEQTPSRNLAFTRVDGEQNDEITVVGYMPDEDQIAKLNIENEPQKEVGMSVEDINEELSKSFGDSVTFELPTDYENLFDEKPETDNLHAENSADGLILSLSTLGKVDIEFISRVTGFDMKKVIIDLRGAIFQNPEKWDELFYKGWETKEEYLSGNLMAKLRLARRQNVIHNGYFEQNVKAIESVLPKAVAFDKIYVTLGTPWLPKDMVEDYVRYLLNFKQSGFLEHDNLTGVWKFNYKSDLAYYADYTKTYITYGTVRLNAFHLIERTLNMRTIRVTDEWVDPITKKKKRVLNEKETFLALDCQKRVISEFNDWLKRDEDRMERIERIYEDNFCCIRKRQFDGSFLTFPGINDGIILYPYQKNAVARILFSPNVLLAHEVGAGKTYIMIAAGMELKRMGISAKNMYVVPNNITEQWYKLFKSIYSKARVLVITPKDFTPSKRQRALSAIKDNDYDAVIISYSCFSLIPVSQKYIIEDYKERIAELTATVNTDEGTTSVLDKIETLKKELSEIAVKGEKITGITFDQLGINTLFVDEAHNFKNVTYATKTGGILGLNSEGSKKCNDMLNKVKCVQKNNGGRGVVFATGTPITNSIADLYVMQQYLQSGMLASLNIGTFDAWVGNFAEMVTGFEVDVDTSGYRMARRFAKFHNLPELTSLLSLIADFHSASGGDSLPIFTGHTESLTDKHEDLAKYIQDISARADDVRKRRVKVTEDNMLKITTDGRKAALDVRLVDEKANFSKDSKIFDCARRVSEIYFSGYEDGATQLVFCDSSTPKPTFNAYGELKRLLILLGVKPEEIAFIHEATSDTLRENLFEKVRKSQIRVLIGSTWKLGMGVNIQDRLLAIHHLDVPWRPADMVQREGRILRQGNQNERVYIYRYITKGTFDAYSWQLLETKQRFIAGLLSGSMKARNGSDVGDTVLNYAEVKALAIGNPLVKKRVETANELSKYLSFQKRAEELKVEIASQIDMIPKFIENKQKAIESCQKDIEFYEQNKVVYDREQLKELGKTILTGLDQNEFNVNERKVATYQGFDVILPAGMLKTEPYLYLEKEGRYKLEFKWTDIGIMIRLNNLLEGLKDQLEKLIQAKLRLESKLEGLKEESQKQENYGDKIQELQEELAEIDKKLGVDKR